MTSIKTTNGLRSWLLQTHSLTERLATVAGEASLHVLNQGIIDGWWQRDIKMMAQGEPCWFARTLVSESTWVACQDFFDQLTTKSLGQLIYHSPIVQRLSLVHYPIGRAAAQCRWLPVEIEQQCLSALWMRSSHFRLQPVMSSQTFYFFQLTEIFLPAMQRYCQ